MDTEVLHELHQSITALAPTPTPDPTHGLDDEMPLATVDETVAETEPMSPGVVRRKAVRRSRKLAALKTASDVNALAKSYDWSTDGSLLAGGFEIRTTGVRRVPVAAVEEEPAAMRDRAATDPPPVARQSSPSKRKRRRRKQKRLVYEDLPRVSPEDVVRFGELGRGQNGVVHKALHLESLSVVALKAVNVYNRSARHQFLKELVAFDKAAGHPCIVEFVNAYVEPERAVLTLCMEFMSRGSLQDAVERLGPVPEPVLRVLVRQLVLGLHHIHSNRQVHRDLKPANILLNHYGALKLADFGLLKQLTDDNQYCETFAGTLVYLSPERLRTQRFSMPADIWSLGITVIFAATGELPFRNDYWSLVTQIQNKEPPSLDAERFSPELVSFVDHCLRKEPDERLTARALLAHPFLSRVKVHKKPRKIMTPELLRMWPIHEPIHSVTASDVDCMLRILVEHFYHDGVFADTLYDSIRLQRVADSFGVPPDVVRERFQLALQLYAQPPNDVSNHVDSDQT